MNARYECRRSGACCTAGWHIPVEPQLRPLLGTDVLVPDSSGACHHFDRGSRLCLIHRDHREAQLPAACHHVPRRALVDHRGVFITLSHYCPTAAAALVDEDATPLGVVEERWRRREPQRALCHTARPMKKGPSRSR